MIAVTVHLTCHCEEVSRVTAIQGSPDTWAIKTNRALLPILRAGRKPTKPRGQPREASPANHRSRSKRLRPSFSGGAPSRSPAPTGVMTRRRLLKTCKVSICFEHPQHFRCWPFADLNSGSADVRSQWQSKPSTWTRRLPSLTHSRLGKRCSSTHWTNYPCGSGQSIDIR